MFALAVPGCLLSKHFGPIPSSDLPWSDLSEVCVWDGGVRRETVWLFTSQSTVRVATPSLVVAVLSGVRCACCTPSGVGYWSCH